MLALRDGERDAIESNALSAPHSDIFQFNEWGQETILKRSMSLEFDGSR